MNQKKKKDETNGYRKTNGKESDDDEEPSGKGSRKSIIGHNGIDVREYLTNIFRTGERRLPLKSE